LFLDADGLGFFNDDDLSMLHLSGTALGVPFNNWEIPT
jgi:hypothetical protein